MLYRTPRTISLNLGPVRGSDPRRIRNSASEYRQIQIPQMACPLPRQIRLDQDKFATPYGTVCSVPSAVQNNAEHPLMDAVLNRY